MTRSLAHRLFRRGVRVPWLWIHIPVISPHSDRLRAAALGPPCRPFLTVIDGRPITALIR
jgi:hypothetical protein